MVTCLYFIREALKKRKKFYIFFIRRGDYDLTFHLWVELEFCLGNWSRGELYQNMIPLTSKLQTHGLMLNESAHMILYSSALDQFLELNSSSTQM